MNTSQLRPGSPAVRTNGGSASPPKFPWVIALCVFLFVVLITTLVTFILPEVYSSTARFRLERDESNERATLWDSYYIQTEFEVIQSEEVLSKVVRDLNLNVEWGRRFAGGGVLKTNESITLLKARMELRPVRDTHLVEVRVFSEEPDEAARIANAIVKAYLEYRRETREELNTANFHLLEQKHEENEQKIQRLQAEIAELARVQSSPSSNLLAEAQTSLKALQEFDQVLSGKIESEKPIAGMIRDPMVQIADRAAPGLRPVRPNKPLIIAIGTIMGCLAGLFPATVVYRVRLRKHRRQGRTP